MVNAGGKERGRSPLSITSEYSVWVAVHTPTCNIVTTSVDNEGKKEKYGQTGGWMDG